MHLIGVYDNDIARFPLDLDLVNVYVDCVFQNKQHLDIFVVVLVYAPVHAGAEQHQKIRQGIVGVVDLVDDNGVACGVKMSEVVVQHFCNPVCVFHGSLLLYHIVII